MKIKKQDIVTEKSKNFTYNNALKIGDELKHVSNSVISLNKLSKAENWFVSTGKGNALDDIRASYPEIYKSLLEEKYNDALSELDKLYKESKTKEEKQKLTNLANSICDCALDTGENLDEERKKEINDKKTYWNYRLELFINTAGENELRLYSPNYNKLTLEDILFLKDNYYKEQKVHDAFQKYIGQVDDDLQEERQENFKEFYKNEVQKRKTTSNNDKEENLKTKKEKESKKEQKNTVKQSQSNKQKRKQKTEKNNKKQK